MGGFWKDDLETHQALLGAGIWVIGGLYLSGVEPDDYELICLQLKVEDGDGAPAVYGPLCSPQRSVGVRR